MIAFVVSVLVFSQIGNAATLCDFENGFDGWKAQDTAFGDAPAKGTIKTETDKQDRMEQQPGIGGFLGEHLANSKAKNIISPHKALFTDPPKHTPSFIVVDGPITGNGDIGLTVSGKPDSQRYWISKNDFWKSGPDFKQCGPSLIGGIDVRIQDLADASYQAEQVLYEPVISSKFEVTDNMVNMDARVAATDNVIILELKVNNKPVKVNLDLWAKDGYGSETDSGREKDVFWVTRKFDSDELMYPSAATIAMRCLDSNAASFTLEPGDPVTIVASVITNNESETYDTQAREKVAGLNPTEVGRIISEHNNWWSSFWAKSFVEMEDKLLEKYYYASIYIMACCSRNVNFPPGLYGNWITMSRTAWAGDIHLNYNHEAPYWALYSSNRIEITDTYDAPLLEHLSIFRENAKKYLNKKGAYASVGIGPKGLSSRFFDKAGMDLIYGKKFGSGAYQVLTGQPMFLGQKSNAVFASMNMILRYHYTYDNEYIKKVYPYLEAVAEFWEDYLVFEGGRYVIYDDSFHEVGPWQGKNWEEGYGDFNPINSLGFLKIFFAAMVEISQDMGIDEDKQGKWNHILANLSDFPVYMENGRKRFRACEGGNGSSSGLKGFKWHMMHGLVFPAPNIGLSSDPAHLKMILDDMKNWGDGTWLSSGNSIQSVLIGAARVGYDPDILFDKAKKKIERYSYPNLWISAEGGGIETCSAIPGMINEMMLQSHRDVIRIFPVFPGDQKASYYRLRTFGAFLVSSAVDNGLVQYVIIKSEKGRDCKILNPWPDKQVTLYRNGEEAQKVTGKELFFKTEHGEKLLLAPEGTSINEISAFGSKCRQTAPRKP